MTRYVALLRGINVGGRSAVPMAGLRALLGELRLRDVRTHRGSGNALFASELPEAALEEMLARALEARFGFAIPVLVRSAAEIEAVVEGLPFAQEQIARAQAAAGAAESLYVAFLSAPPDEALRARFDAKKQPGEEIAVSGRALYLLLEHSVRDCKLFAGMNRLDPRATVRNWNTVRKLSEMLRA